MSDRDIGGARGHQPDVLRVARHWGHQPGMQRHAEGRHARSGHWGSQGTSARCAEGRHARSDISQACRDMLREGGYGTSARHAGTC